MPRINVCYKIDVFFLLLVVILCLHAEEPIVVSKSGLCLNNSLSCSHQIPSSDSKNECYMEFFQSSACDTSPSEGAVMSSSDEYGTVNLGSYVYLDSPHADTAFNVTFSNIKWTSLRMWFKKQSNDTFGCRTFTVSTQLPPDTIIFFDCFLSIIERSVYTYQYEVTPHIGAPISHSYLFIAPSSTNSSPNTGIRDWELFLVVDISDLRKLQLHIQIAPLKFQVTHYVVTLRRSSKEGGNSWEVFSTKIAVPPNITEGTILKSPAYDTFCKPGIYSYTVAMIGNSECNKYECKTESALVHLVPYFQRKLLMGIVAFVLIIPILIAAFFILRRRWKEPPVVEKSNILLIYNPYYRSHVDNVIGLYNFLKESCNLHPILDLFSIPETKSKDPTKWYLTEAFKEVKTILVLASPLGEQSLVPHRLNTYLHLDKISLNHLRTRLALKEPHSHAVSVQLPDCSSDTLPKEAKHLRRFVLPRDLNPLLVYLGSAPKYDNGAEFLAALKKASTSVPQPITPSGLYTVSHNVAEPDSHPPLDPRTPVDPDGREIILNSEDFEEESKPLFNHSIGKSINLNLSGDC